MKPIKITNAQKSLALANFQKFLDTTKSLEDNVSFKVDLGAVLGNPVMPTIQITAHAYLKLMTLVAACPMEVAWHGLVQCPAPNVYTIIDIIVYPQVVSGTSVDTDQAEYETWLHQLDDETFNALRMQGHSHVNMGSSPSGPDWVLYDKMLQGMTRIPYYIFMVTNKRSEMFLMLYDFTQNICFETKDCKWTIIMDDNESLQVWQTETLKAVRTPTVTPPAGTTYIYPKASNYLDKWEQDRLNAYTQRSY